MSSALIIRANSRKLPLADASVHCAVTSPPYWGLRAYGGDADMIGLEPTFDEHLGNLVEVFREVWRVLRDDESAYPRLEELASRLAGGVEEAATRAGVPLAVVVMMTGLILLAVRRVWFGDRYRPDRSFGAASGGWPLSPTDDGSGIVVGGVARFLLVGLVFEAVSQRLGLLSAASGIQLTPNLLAFELADEIEQRARRTAARVSVEKAQTHHEASERGRRRSVSPVQSTDFVPASVVTRASQERSV